MNYRWWFLSDSLIIPTETQSRITRAVNGTINYLSAARKRLISILIERKVNRNSEPWNGNLIFFTYSGMGP